MSPRTWASSRSTGVEPSRSSWTHNPAVAGDPADKGGRDLFAFAQSLEEIAVLGSEQQGVVLLELGAPDLEHREGLVADGEGADLDSRPRRLDDLLEYIAVAAGALVVDRDDGVVGPELAAGPDHPVDLLLHLGVAALDGVEVELGDILALDHGRGGAAAHPDAVGRAAELDHPHPDLGCALGDVSVVHLADAAGEHDGFDPLAAFARGQPQSEGPGEALDHRFAELVAVVRGAVGGLDLDLERAGQIVRVGEARVLPGLRVAGDLEIADAVGGGAGGVVGAAAGGVDIADPAAGAGFGAGKGRDAGWEIVGLGGEDDVLIDLGLASAATAAPGSDGSNGCRWRRRGSSSSCR